MIVFEFQAFMRMMLGFYFPRHTKSAKRIYHRSKSPLLSLTGVMLVLIRTKLLILQKTRKDCGHLSVQRNTLLWAIISKILHQKIKKNWEKHFKNT